MCRCTVEISDADEAIVGIKAVFTLVSRSCVSCVGLQ